MHRSFALCHIYICFPYFFYYAPLTVLGMEVLGMQIRSHAHTRTHT